MIKRLQKFRRGPWLWVVLALVLIPGIVIAVMLALNGVDTGVTDSDRTVIAELGVDDACHGVETFDDELDCISTVQDRVFELFPDTTCEFERGETGHRAADYAERGYGCCYDRATLLEQTLRHYGFDARRVGVYGHQPNPLRYFLPGIPSHALSEIETQKGWMAVDSIDPVIAIDGDDEIYDIAAVRRGIRDGTIDDETFGVDIPGNFFDGEFIYARGVYSRHGYFFEPHLPVPEIDWGRFEVPR